MKKHVEQQVFFNKQQQQQDGSLKDRVTSCVSLKLSSVPPPLQVGSLVGSGLGPMTNTMLWLSAGTWVDYIDLMLTSVMSVR